MFKLILGILSLLSSSSVFANESGDQNFIQVINHYFGSFLFWDIPFIHLPLIIFVMVSGGIFFTFRYGFINVRLFKHAIDVIAGKFDDPNDEGEISHFQALTSALSATVGLGNIAGVAVAINLGGPGAVFWLWVAAFFGMSMKFSSCTFAQLYRKVADDGHVLGGPMVYLKEGLTQLRNWPLAGKVLGTIYAIMCIGASFGGGNMFQGNQTYELLSNQFPALQGNALIVGLVLGALAGFVLLGGIKRIADVTSKLVPAMCIFYVLSCLAIIIGNFGEVGNVFSEIFRQAFNPDAMFAGGFIGVLVQGLRRASFSNEAGVGSAAIAHAAAKTKEPVREGVVAMIGPTIDTHIVCTMTSLAILITGTHLRPELANSGAQITAEAFATLGSFMPVLLTIAASIFAYSTIISWSYYGEKATEYLFGTKAILPYRIIYVIIVALGPVLSLGTVIEFSDLMLLSMAFPNIIGMMLMSSRVRGMVVDYYTRFKSGQMPQYK